MTEIITKKPVETFLLGKRFSKQLKIGDVVCFYGGLGTGKTCFIQGVCKGLGIKNNVISPSFTIINEYSGDFIIYHIDFYRIEKIGELKELGFEEYLYNNGICLIEWADKVESFLPPNKIIVRMEFVKDKNNWRRIRIEK
jgi:tRNA threonylcarbamoyladenosine biosynthesis protein TsaE